MRWIEDLDFSVHTYHVLQKAGIRFEEEIQKMNDVQLSNMIGSSREVVNEIRSKVCFHGGITRSDSLRASTDEELAHALVEIGWGCENCSEHERLENEPLLRGEQCDEKCEEHCLEWLKKPMEKERADKC